MSITPDQLPSRVSNFIAYGPEERAADPTNDGEVITARPQVYVRYFPAIVVSGLQEGGRSGNREGLVTVQFDPASIGFKDPISAHMNSDDRTLPALRNSLENKAPLAIAIETQRKKKNSEDGSPISPLTPIHALRGASQPNGDGDGRMMMGPSGNNTSNRVAFVNGQGTQHLQSNPAEWKMLVNNKAGDLPPEGWRKHTPGEDWKEIGAVVRDGAPVPSSQTATPGPVSGFPTPDQLGDLIRGIVGQSLKEFAPALANQIAQASGAVPSTPQGRPSGKFDEGKQWHPRTSDGRINLGGYVVSSERWVFEWAYRHLTEDLEIEVSTDDTWTLTDAVFTMASAVQANAYGHGFVPDRASASHRQAEHWVQWVIKRMLPYPGLDADEETLSGWTEEVTNEATALLTEAGRRAGEYFSSVSKRDKNGAAPQASTSDEDEAQSGPSEKVVRAFLDVVQKGWDNPETIKNLGIQGRENGYANIPVSMTTDEDGVQIAYPPAEGQPTGPLESLLIHRYTALTSQGQGPAQDATDAQGEPGAPAQEQNSPEQSAPEQDAASSAPAEVNEQTATDEASAPSAPATQEGDPAYSLIERLKVVSDDQALRAIYEDAKEANLIATKVYVAPGPNGEVIFGQEGQDGFQVKTIGSVVGIIRASLVNATNDSNATDGAAPASQDQQTPSNEAPQTADAPQEDTDSAPEQTPAEETQTVSEAPQETPEAPAEPTESEEEEQAPEAEVETPQNDAPEQAEGGDAQRIADAAGSASTLDEIAVLKTEADEKGLSTAPVTVGGTEGVLGLWIDHKKRRLTRAQRASK